MTLLDIDPQDHSCQAPRCATASRQPVCDACRVRNLSVCSGLSTHDSAALQRLAHRTNLSPRAPLIQAGTPAISVYSVTSGTLRLQRDLADGRRQIVGFAVAGDFIGLALQDTYSFSADALTASTLCRFDRAMFSQLCQKKPDLLAKLHQAAANELTLAYEQMVLLGRLRAEERIAAFLLRWRLRMARLSGASAALHLPMGRQDIADYLGLTIETVSRTFARWMRERVLLDIPDGVRIVDLEALEALSQS
jgi:CRP/FNR family transcriptional regulator, anaerobic regulatory protein